MKGKTDFLPNKEKADNLLPLLTVVRPVCSRYIYFPSNLYWTDWNREAPKIETSTVNGANRRVLVNRDIGLPNGLTFDPFSKLLCWADAGKFTKDRSNYDTLSLKGK